MDKGQQERRPRGRPTILSGLVKRYPIGVRTTKQLKDLLQGAADSSGHSLGQEAVLRLERSFEIEKEIEKAFGGPQTQRMVRALAALAPDDEWTDHWFTRRIVFSLWTRRVINESPDSLAQDVARCRITKGTEEAKLLAISYYSHVRNEFSKRDQREYCQIVKDLVGLSPEQLANGEGVGS
jgi:hypothetical protein